MGRLRRWSCALTGAAALSLALAAVPITRFAFTALPAAFDFSNSDRFSTWASLSGSVVSASGLVIAGFAPDRPVRRPLRTAAWAATAGLLVLATIGTAIGLTAGRLPVGIDPGISPENASLSSGHPAILAMQFVFALLLFFAAWGFNRRAAGGEEFYTWLTAAAVVGAFSRINYALFPSLYTDWVYSGDFFRLLFYLLILVAVLRQIGAYQAQIARSAALDERRRLAREYHDGLAQELAFIVARLQPLTREHSFLQPIRAASERALQECRWAIGALTVSSNEKLSTALADTVEEIAAREGTRLELDIAPDVDVPRKSQEALLRIAGEALRNAVRHGQAESVRVELLNGERVILRIHDDGVGFDTRTVNRDGGGFGLVSMRERIAAAGGEFRMVSKEGAGTLVEVRLP